MIAAVAVDDPGTLAFALSGRLTRVDYDEVLLPPIRATIERGEDLRVLALVEDFSGLEAGGLLDDLQAAARLGSGQREIRSSFALVTDLDWLRRGAAAFGWLIPGELRVFPTTRRADAERWLTAAGPR